MDAIKNLLKIQLYSQDYKKFIDILLGFSKNTSPETKNEEVLVNSLKEVAPLLSIRFRLGAIIRSAYHLSVDHNYKDVFNYLFDNLQEVIPLDRIGVALIHDGDLYAHWVKSKHEVKYLNTGYSASIKEGSLATLIDTGTPRIISDLREYKKLHPQSKSTELALKDGILSSLTFPLVGSKGPIGVIFFSSHFANTYTEEHIQIFQEIANDFTVILEQGRQLEQQNDNLTNDKMLSMVVHDLRAPVGVMIGFLDLLFEEVWYEKLNDKDKEVFSILKKNSVNMLELINGLSDIKKISHGHMEFQVQGVVIRPYLNEIFFKARILGQLKNIHANLEVSEEIPELVYFDPNRIRQALDNLISNAVKFSNPQTSVTIKVYREDEKLYFSVSDQGPGIPLNEQTKLFTEFGKTSVRPTAGEYSTGLGLVIVKRIVESCGGSISFRSEVGKGSEFTFYIPFITHG
jgi:signal transduction histidine kinase